MAAAATQSWALRNWYTPGQPLGQNTRAQGHRLEAAGMARPPLPPRSQKPKGRQGKSGRGWSHHGTQHDLLVPGHGAHLFQPLGRQLQRGPAGALRCAEGPSRLDVARVDRARCAQAAAAAPAGAALGAGTRAKNRLPGGEASCAVFSAWCQPARPKPVVLASWLASCLNLQPIQTQRSMLRKTVLRAGMGAPAAPRGCP